MRNAKQADLSRRRILSWTANLAVLGVGGWLATSAHFAQAAKQEGSEIIVTGKDRSKQESPFACTLEKMLSKEQRAHKKEIAMKMESARMETKELADGYVFRFRPEAISFSEIADWVNTERTCCPFFDLSLEAERENGPYSLRVTGREGVKTFIRSEFHILKLG